MQNDYAPSLTPQNTEITPAQILRALCALVGAACILAGLIFAIRLFQFVFGGLSQPETFGELYPRWIEALGGEQLDVEIIGVAYKGAPYIVLIGLWAGLFFLASLTFNLVRAGTGVVVALTRRETPRPSRPAPPDPHVKA